jgi:DNA polymerase-4
MSEFTNITKLLQESTTTVFEKWYKKSAAKIRLLGFGVSGLRLEGSGQQLLFSDPKNEKQKTIDTVLDKIRDKYGDDVLKRGE